MIQRGLMLVLCTWMMVIYFLNINPVEIGVSGDSIDLEMRVFEGGQATIKSFDFRE